MEAEKDIRILEEEISKLELNKKNLENIKDSFSNENNRLNIELDSLMYPNNQVLKIEKYLADKYQKNLGTYKINREQEEEIAKLLILKKDKYKKIIYDHKESYAGTIDKRNEAIKKDSIYYIELRKEAFRGIYSERDWERDIEKVYKEEEKSNKKINKEYDAILKNISKETASELKKLFLELDIDLNRFYKSGISKVYFKRISDEMKEVAESIEEYGQLPASYSSKMYKWEVTLNEIPEDLEYLEKEEVAKAKNRIEEKQNENSETLKEHRKTIASLKSSKEKLSQELYAVIKRIDGHKNDENTIEDLKTQLANIKEEYLINLSKKIDDLKLENVNTIQTIKDDYLEKINNFKIKISAEKSQRVNELQNNKTILENEVNEYKNKVAFIERDLLEEQNNKKQLEDTLNSTNSLFFVKRKKLKEELNNSEMRVLDLENNKKDLLETIKNSENEFSKLNEDELIESFDVVLKEGIRELEEKKANDINEKNNDLDSELIKLENIKIDDFKKFDEDTNNKIEGLNNDKRELINQRELLEHKIEDVDKKLEKLTTESNDIKESIQQLDKKLLNFHNDYLIKKYSKDCGINEEIKFIKEEIKKCNNNAINIVKELSIIESKLEKLYSKRNELKLIVDKEKESKLLEEEKSKSWLDEENRKKENEKKLISNNEDIKNLREQLYNKINSIDFEELKNIKVPYLDKGSPILTGNVVVRRLVQDFDGRSSEKYIIFFVDNQKNIISDIRLIENKEKGHENKLSFDLKFGDDQYIGNVYALIFSTESLEIAGLLEYKANISFADDFI